MLVCGGEVLALVCGGEGVSVSSTYVCACVRVHIVISHASCFPRKILVSAASYSSLGRDQNQRKSQEKRLLAHLVGWLLRLWIRCVRVHVWVWEGG